MTTAEYKQRRKRNLRRSKFYRRWPGDDRWLILDRAVLRDCVILSTVRRFIDRPGGDYCVYIDLLIKNSIPSDKFTGTRRDADGLFKDIVARKRAEE